MKRPLYQVDAFASARFRGNPAAVVPLERWPNDALLQAIAEENRLSETAFFVPVREDGPPDVDYHLRWFTPVVEVDLCGHATLATGHVLFRHLGFPRDRVTFRSRGGRLSVARAGDRLELDFPAVSCSPAEPDPALDGALGARPDELYRVPEGVLDGFLAVFPRERDVRELAPDFGRLRGIGAGVAIATAPGEAEVDFVSRVFAPGVGIDEDPVTGAAHCALAPYWSARLGRAELHARQVSARGGDVHCAVGGDRVRLGGTAVTYLEGTIEID
jgi:PhzF family phenazine biosynthesis protein